MDLLEGGNGLAIYLGLKLTGYLLWSYTGVRWFSPQTPKPFKLGLALGFGRLVIGWLAGILVGPFVLVAAMDHLPVFYFTGLVLVRWVEWGIIQSLIPRAPGAPPVLLTGGTAQGRVWRIVGILISYLADAPFLLTEGFPHGRFFC